MSTETPRTQIVAARLDALSLAVAEGRRDEFTMRIPAEPDRDADLVLSEAARMVRDLTAAREQSEARKTALQFAERAIEDAIYTEDGLDGEAGERVLHVIQEAMERGTFDQTKIGELGQSTLQQLADMEAERDAARARVAELEKAGRELVRLKALHDRIDGGWGTLNDSIDYSSHKALAWQAMRALLAPSPEPKP